MANDLAATLKRGHDTFYQRVANYRPWWRDLTDPIDNGGKPEYKQSQVYGLTVFDAIADAPTPKDLGSEGSTTAIAAFEQIVKIRLDHARNNPGLVENTLLNFADLWHLTISRAMRDGIVALDTTTHPLNGASSGILTAQGGGTVYVADDFTVTPPNASAFNQTNLLTTAFSAAALSVALEGRWEYLDYSGNETFTGAMDEEKPYLIVPSDLSTEANDLWERRGEIYDGSGLQSGSFGARLRGAPITLPGSVADANDFWLWWKKTMVTDADNDDGTPATIQVGPIAPIIRSSPRVTFAESDDSHHLVLKGFGEYALHYFTDCDQRVVMNKVA